MKKLIITGGVPLKGNLHVSRSKNAYLPILAATLLNKNPVTLKNIPDLRDIRTMFSLMEHFGVKITPLGKRDFSFDASNISSLEAPYNVVKTMRASICVLGPLLARFAKAKVSFPGGCAIGIRPIDLHLTNLQKMGVTIEVEEGHIKAKTSGLNPISIELDFPSVGATENLIMASVFTPGKTVIENAALEPEVGDLIGFLNTMGANIAGAGTTTIDIRGVSDLKSCAYEAIGDRIEAGTYIMAALATGGQVQVRGFNPMHLECVIEKLRGMGAKLVLGPDFVKVEPSNLRAVKVETRPYPGFPTDLQAQLTALCLRAKGTSVITEKIFENRFMHIGELRRLGAQIDLEGRTVFIQETADLKGAPLMCTDLRASAALVISGLIASGQTEILRIYHLERGHEDLFGKLQKLGARIEKTRTRPYSDI